MHKNGLKPRGNLLKRVWCKRINGRSFCSKRSTGSITTNRILFGSESILRMKLCLRRLHSRRCRWRRQDFLNRQIKTTINTLTIRPVKHKQVMQNYRGCKMKKLNEELPQLYKMKTRTVVTHCQ